MDHHVLLPIVKRLEDHRIPYSLGGSALLYYLDIINVVNDWDLMVECPKDALIRAFEGLDWVEQGSGEYPFASQYRISLDSLNIDCIGYFAFHTKEGILRLPVRSFEKWDNIRISSPEVWYVAYCLMNRKLKADLLFEYLMNHRTKVNAELVKELMAAKCLPEEERESLRLLLPSS